ncbi:FAD-binding oxidoreductase [Acidihalobacter ferrooxydans]|uniref:FAD-linked oxidase n=1 Tax=Acidihalobacter ferrooxydans TaxID=1765967 RepID=A0A1P8UGI9_9GAMM|nr:FAD-binding oxidoreductase [Acidihalobacter ferrooxydans]APZ42967.1 FAD-linked oxidase [Acidihalobacter ferrooxydans]
MCAAFDLATLRRQAPEVEWLDDEAQRKRASRDFSWFSPVLKRALDCARAEAVARPADQSQALAVIAACARQGVPLTLRGAGTGNYGQCVPLHGGVVMDMSRLDRILGIADGVVRVEAGARLADIDTAVREHGWELRLMPSTYRMATAGGFYAGGFGGIGSIRYGSLEEPGNVLAAKVAPMTARPEPIEVRGMAVRDLYHAYGTNGVLLELEYALAPCLPWVERLYTFAAFMDAARFGHALAHAAVDLRLLTVLDAPIPPLIGLEGKVPDGQCAVLMVVSRTGVEVADALAAQGGGHLAFEQDHAAAFGTARSLIEYTWNHTTLRALRRDQAITYLQSDFPPGQALELVEAMRSRYGAEVLMHLEFLRRGNVPSCAGLQLVRYRSEARLREIIAEHRAAGVYIADPHTWLLDEGGRSNPGQMALKRRFDPHGLLNPGKLTTDGYEGLKP